MNQETINNDYVHTDFPEGQEPLTVTNVTNVASVTPMHLKKGDALIVMLFERRGPNEKERIHATFKAAFPNNDIVVIDSTADFAIVRPGEQPPESPGWSPPYPDAVSERAL